MKILFLEPFFGGSHRSFAEGWKQNSRHKIEILGLPARRWKWRMRHSGIHFASEVQKLFQASDFDLVVGSSMLPLAEWKGLVGDSWRSIPTAIYFHENQLTYPLQNPDEKPDYQYGFSNIVSCYAADQVWFNSEFHRTSFLQAAESLLKRMPDFQTLDRLKNVSQKSIVLHPGLDFPVAELAIEQKDSTPITILWPHRWEYDKAPETFLSFLIELHKEINFRLILLGEKYSKVPSEMLQVQKLFRDQILHCGFLESKVDYWKWIRRADVAVSTANHEFFGMAMLEAASQGVACLVPNRLAYPELFSNQSTLHNLCLYQSDIREMVQKIVSWGSNRETLEEAKKWCRTLAQKHHWTTAAIQLDDCAEGILAHRK